MQLTLGRYVQQQIDAQGISVKQFATRGGLGLSHAYQILRDERQQLTMDTLEGIARGLGRTLPELFIALGKGQSELAPEEMHLLSLFRQVPEERRPAAADMLRGLAIFPVEQPSNPHKGRAAKRPDDALREQPGSKHKGAKSAEQGRLSRHYSSARHALLALFRVPDWRLPTSPALS